VGAEISVLVAFAPKFDKRS